MTGYRALAVLAERELELVSVGELEKLPALYAERSALMSALPATPPETARSALERAATIQALVTQVLEEGLQQAGSDLRRLDRGRTAVQGYAPPAEPLKLVDRAG